MVAALLALGLGGGPAPALTAAALAFIAGLCSLARLNPALRKTDLGEVRGNQPAAQVR
jgi:DHA2 family multidrug resistance protein-like MFS transporter